MGLKVQPVEKKGVTVRQNAVRTESGSFDQRWMNTRQAAMYCGYESADHFRQLANEKRVPRHGPGNNRYDRFELDEWMMNPRCFVVDQRTAVARGRNRAFVPIHCMVAGLLERRKREAVILFDDDKE
jgi:hypothetical protein